MSDKIFHFHIEDGFGNKSTLECKLINGSIKYSYYSGTSSSGIPLALSNLQCSLPVDNKNKMSKQAFKEMVRHIINNESTRRVVNEVETEVTFG